MIDVSHPPACKDECACGVHPLAHPKYSFGMLLEPRQLVLEHQYNARRANTHNIRLHDFGTVCGLRVEKHPSPQCVNTYAILRPGIALDCCGREIVVPENLFVPLYAGATSGWCGATMGLTSTPPAPVPNATLYIYLRYAQCDTDPIPTYVRACGCCAPCEHDGCTPSVTREGYEVLVSAAPPVPWSNPIGTAFCEWLEVKLNGPGQDPAGQTLANETLDQVLCDVVTQACADLCCVGQNDLLLLATVTFDANAALAGIDNCTGRRLVLPTGAIVEALACLTKAEIACCAASDAYLGLAATVTPTSVNLASPPAGNALAYAVTVTNSGTTSGAENFEIALAFPASGLAFDSATLTVAGTAQAAPAGNASGVTVTISSLAAGQSAELVVNATFDPAAQQNGSSIVATASIAGYTGGHAAAVTLTTTFTQHISDGPRVITTDLPTGPLVLERVWSLFKGGLPLPFTAAMDPATAVASTSTVPGTVTLAATYGDGTTTIVPCELSWNTGNTTLKIQAAPALEATGAPPVRVTISLAGGTKGGTFTGAALRSADDATRLDGSPATGGNVAGQSGDGTQGGDFVYTLTIEETQS